MARYYCPYCGQFGFATPIPKEGVSHDSLRVCPLCKEPHRQRVDHEFVDIRVIVHKTQEAV